MPECVCKTIPPQNDGDLAQMIEDEIQRSLAALTHLAVHPLILPDP